MLWRGGMSFDYASERLEPSITWYDRHSTTARHRFYALQGLQLLAATLTTVLAAWTDAQVPRPVLAAVSAVSALAAGALSLGGWQQLWIRYRGAAETLKREKYLYSAQAGPYASGGGIALLAERCEGVVLSEYEGWQEEMKHRAGGKAATE